MFSRIYEAVEAFTGWIWGVPILVILIGGGIIISVAIGGIQFTRIGFILKQTIGGLFNKEEQARKKAAGVTPYQAVLAALAGTIGTGNIVGVGAAIAVGGPGALFWMWVCGFVAMGIKFSEVTMSCKYREKQENGSYRAGPFMYIKDGLHCLPYACAFGIMMLITLTIICGVHSNAVTSNLANVGVPSIVTCVILAVFAILVIVGGMKGLVKITDKMIPFMTVLYAFSALIIIFANIGNIGHVFAAIFKGAFTGTSAIGGFGGAAVAMAIRHGLARGVFSNDAGLGSSASLQAQAEAIDHPAQQGMWAVVETFIDTIIVCSLTGFMILFSGVWETGAEGAILSATAMGDFFGTAGKYICVVCLALFSISSLISIIEVVRIQAVSMFRSDLLGRIFQILCLALVIGGSLTDLSKVFLFTDFANAFVLMLNIPALILLSKELRSTTKEWFDNNGDLELIAKKRAAKTNI